MSTPWWFFLIAAGLIVMSGFFSGLNLGLMSLAPDELKVPPRAPAGAERGSRRRAVET